MFNSYNTFQSFITRVNYYYFFCFNLLLQFDKHLDQPVYLTDGFDSSVWLLTYYILQFEDTFFLFLI